MMAHLSKAAGARVLALDYRLAPEHPFPAPVEDSVAAYRWLLGEGYDPARIALGGDSAGGGLTVAALVQIRYVGLPMAAAGVCVSPWVDMEGLGESMETRAAVDPMVGKENLMVSAKNLPGRRRPQGAAGRALVRRPARPAAAADTGWGTLRCCWTTRRAWPEWPARLASECKWMCGTI